MAKKNKAKTIEVDRMRPYYLKNNDDGLQTEELLDLTPVLKKIRDAPAQGTRKIIFGDSYIFHTCKFNEKNGVWELQILHLREKILPGIATTNGEYELIKLEDGKYPAESTTFFYDQNEHDLYMQRNYMGISIRTMELYLQEMYPEGTLIILNPYTHGKQINKIKPTSLYRKLILCADTEGITEDNCKPGLFSFLKNLKTYQGRYIKVEFSFGHSRSGFLKADETAKLVKEAYDYNGTRTLKVRAGNPDPDDISFETINLLDDREKFYIDLTYSRDNPITHERIFAACMEEYNKNDQA